METADDLSYHYEARPGCYECLRFGKNTPSRVNGHNDRRMRDLDRKKLFEAIEFFTKNTKSCGLVKLFKLLYYLDMLHFREVGRPVTGAQYRALPYGPVPNDLYDEIRDPNSDLSLVFEITSPPPPGEDQSEPTRTTIRSRRKMSAGHLTKREIRIANEIAEIFREVSAKDISDISHARNGPWDKAKKAGAGKWGIPIDYLDSININFGSGKVSSLEELKERLEEYNELRDHFA